MRSTLSTRIPKLLGYAIVFLLAFCFLLTGTLFAQTDIGPDSVWTPSQSALTNLQDCYFGNNDVMACVVAVMDDDGASSQAIAFVRQLDGWGFLEQFYEMGTVDIGGISYPGRANDNFQPVLLNGSPQLVHIPDKVFDLDLRQAPNYPALIAKDPDLILWAGDNNFVGMEPYITGGQRFIFKFNLVDGCHACDVAGFAYVAFDFDSAGNFLGTELLSLVPVGEQSASFEIAPGWIAYYDLNYNVWLVSSDGKESRLVISQGQPTFNLFEFELNWSPNGRYLAFVRDNYQGQTEGPTLLVYDIDDNSLNPLVSDTNIRAFDWSPDSNYLVYGGIWQVDIQSGEVSRLLEPFRDDILGIGSPRWSPNGQYLAFEEFFAGEGSGFFAIYDVQAKRYQPYNLPLGQYSWSPDSNFLVYDSIIYEEPGPGLSRLHLSGDIDRITTAPVGGTDQTPIVSPNGRYVAFLRSDGQPSDTPLQLWAVDINGANLRQISTLPVNEYLAWYSISWSPDSQNLAIVSKERGLSTINVIEFATGKVQRLVEGYSPTWQPVPEELPDAQPWLDEKAVLINELEELNIPTSLFMVPAVDAFNEDAARELHSQINTKFEQGTLSVEEIEAFARLTLQERAVSEMLPAYTTVAATISDTSVDSIETSLGLIFILRPAWDKCQELLPFCGRLQQASERLVWRMINNSGRMLISASIRVSEPDPELRETMVKFWDLIVRLVEDSFFQGDSLLDLVVDNATEATVTYFLVRQFYLAPTQQFLDDGVITADISEVGDERWSLTGDTVRADMLINFYTDLAAIEEEVALDRHQDFQEAADIIRFAEDITDAATLTPAAIIARAVSLGARAEHLLLINLPEIYLNVQNLNCIGYLSSRAVEVAFDADQPSDNCHDRIETHLSLAPTAKVALPDNDRPVHTISPLQSNLQTEADRYRTAVQKLTEVMQEQDMAIIEPAIEELIQAEASFVATLDEIQSILLERETLNLDELRLLELSNSFSMSSFALYLTLAESLMAQQTESEPQSDMMQAAQETLNQVDEMVQTVERVNLIPSADKTILVIREVKAELTPAQQLQLDIMVRNIGGDEATNVEIALLVDGELVASPVTIEDIAVGATAQTTLQAPVPDASTFAVQVWTQDVLLDTYWSGIPLPMVAEESIEPVVTPMSEIDATAAPETDTKSPNIAEQERLSPKNNQPLIIIGALFVLVLVAAMGLLVWYRWDTVKTATDVNTCPHCGAANPMHGRFCAKCGQRLADK